jgi:hypothetical protein
VAGRLVSAPASAVDLTISPVAELLLECLRQAVVPLGSAAPKLIGLRPGVQVEALLSTLVDECCEGLAWVRVINAYPSTDNFPIIDQAPSRCGPLRWAVVLELGIARCAPTPPANVLTTAAQWTDITLALLDDSAALRRALCCFGDAEPDRLSVVGVWAPLPVLGGCLGGTQLLTVAVDACDCTEPDAS